MIENTWHCYASLSMHESGWLVYKFSNEEDRAKVLSEGLYLVYGRPLVLKPMPEYFDFTSAEMSTVLIWIKFPNLPLKCWSTNCLLKIASVLGGPIQSNMLTSSMERLSYSRVLVEIDLLNELLPFIDVILPNGVPFNNLWCMKQCLNSTPIVEFLGISLVHAPRPLQSMLAKKQKPQAT